MSVIWIHYSFGYWFIYLLACFITYLQSQFLILSFTYFYIYFLAYLFLVCVWRWSSITPFYFHQFLFFVFIYSCTYLLSVHSDSHPHSTVAPHCEPFHPKCKCKHYTYTIPVIFQCGNPQSTGPTGGKQASSVCLCVVVLAAGQFLPLYQTLSRVGCLVETDKPNRRRVTYFVAVCRWECVFP